MASKSSTALVRQRARTRRVAEIGEQKLKKARDRFRRREDNMAAGAILGGIAATALPTLWPASEEFLSQDLTENIKIARHGVAGGVAIYLSYQSRDPMARGALAAAGGAMLGRLAAEIAS